MLWGTVVLHTFALGLPFMLHASLYVLLTSMELELQLCSESVWKISTCFTKKAHCLQPKSHEAGLH